MTWTIANTAGILFGAGISIANAFIASGLADHIAEQLTVLSAVPTLLMILLICLSVTFLTEVTSNTATASLLMPLLASAAVTAAPAPVDPEQLRDLRLAVTDPAD